MAVSPLTSATPAQLAASANAALRGETSNTGSFMADGETHTLNDARLGVGRILLLCPTNAAAGKATWYVPEVKNGTATINFHEPVTGASFAYVIAGAGNTRGI